MTPEKQEEKKTPFDEFLEELNKVAADKPAPVSEQVIRDFIPAGESLTPAEQARISRGVGTNRELRPNEDVILDFVADPKADPTDPVGDAETGARLALEAAERSYKREVASVFARASETVRKFDAQALIDIMQNMSDFDRDVHVIAEGDAQNRQEVMERFPKPSDSTLELFERPGREAREAEERERLEAARVKADIEKQQAEAEKAEAKAIKAAAAKSAKAKAAEEK